MEINSKETGVILCYSMELCRDDRRIRHSTSPILTNETSRDDIMMTTRLIDPERDANTDRLGAGCRVAGGRDRTSCVKLSAPAER
jgi:hypothetical protein